MIIDLSLRYYLFWVISSGHKIVHASFRDV